MVNSRPLKVLFISRAYPPVVGGIEKQNHEIAQALAKIANVQIIANHRGKASLPLFFCYAFFRALTHIPTCDVVLLGDGVLAILGFVVKCLSHKPVVCILHGLDITFRNPFYQQLWLKRFLPAMDKYIAVGNETIRQGVLRGMPKDKFVFIGNGVSFPSSQCQYRRDDLEKIVGRKLPHPVLLTLGRLVKRKGVEWFVRNVMSRLSNETIHIIAGDGKEKQAIQQAIKDRHLESRVIFLGPVNEKQKQVLLHTVDLFVQPNIPVAGDMEGFGLVVLEAAAAGRVVIASRLEGLQDAIHDGKNGILVTPGSAASYASAINTVLQDPRSLRERGNEASFHVQEHFSWAVIAERYLQVFQKLCRPD